MRRVIIQCKNYSVETHWGSFRGAGGEIIRYSNFPNIERQKSNIESNISNIESNVSNIESNISNIESNVSNIESNISNIERQKLAFKIPLADFQYLLLFLLKVQKSGTEVVLN